MIRREFNFMGRVQHVGFRYTACNLAKKYHVTGWVRNEYDGTVSMAAQGEEQNVEAVLYALMNDKYIKIIQYDIKSVDVIEDEKRFQVRY